MGRVFFNTRENVHALTAAYTVLESDSGKVFTVDSAGGAYEITMPTTVGNLEGFNCKFITKEHTPTADVTIAFGSGIVDGYSEDVTADLGVGTNGTAVQGLKIEAAGAKGDTINVMCDGTTWYFEAFSQIHNGITTVAA